MSTLEHFSSFDNLPLEDEIKASLKKLPYRVGYWMSQSDQTGGDQSDEAELRALEGIILSYGEDVCKSELTQIIMDQTVRAYDEWEGWHDHIENVPRECEAAMYHLGAEIDEKFVVDFKESLFEIAETVALAYRESAERDNFLDNLYIKIRIWQAKWDAFIKKYDFSLDKILNISPDEERALRQLKGVLRI